MLKFKLQPQLRVFYKGTKSTFEYKLKVVNVLAQMMDCTSEGKSYCDDTMVHVDSNLQFMGARI